MTKITIQLIDDDYKRLEEVSKRTGKSIQALIYEWIAQLPEAGDRFDVTQDPIYQMEGYDSDAPMDLSINLDKYIYGRENTK